MTPDHFVVRSLRAHVRPLPRQLADEAILDITATIGDIRIRYEHRKADYAITVTAEGRAPSLAAPESAPATARSLGELRYAFFPHLLNETARLLDHVKNGKAGSFVSRVTPQLGNPYMLPGGRWRRIRYRDDDLTLGARCVLPKTNTSPSWHAIVGLSDDIRSIVETYSDTFGAANFSSLGNSCVDAIAEPRKKYR